MPSDIAFRVVPGSADQDRLVHRVVGDAHLVVLADGAGGLAGGREAADFVTANASLPNLTPEACAAELQRLDDAIDRDRQCGETTAVLLVISASTIFGASVGDSGVWTCHREASFDLTAAQHAKPLLGSGRASPITFGPHFFNDRVLVASDGLLKYVPRERIRSLALLNPPSRAVDELIAAARLPSGALQDDLSVALVDP
jgi:serine/threonine protein phosphatase PrpC